MEQLKFNLPDFTNGDIFPIDYTGRGKDISPEIVIENLSENAKTLAVTVEDISHPIKDFTHWVIWNIPATSKIEKVFRKVRAFREWVQYKVWHTVCTDTQVRSRRMVKHTNIELRYIQWIAL